jgi:hypothetical protein
MEALCSLRAGHSPPVHLRSLPAGCFTAGGMITPFWSISIREKGTEKGQIYYWKNVAIYNAGPAIERYRFLGRPSSFIECLSNNP